jgi:hypothetical protein
MSIKRNGRPCKLGGAQDMTMKRNTKITMIKMKTNHNNQEEHKTMIIMKNMAIRKNKRPQQ